ncbi:chymotrypsin-1-like [Chironomus tepperi]|uniref:chymotrypsin-1-like n=1 Tax=Chironomus tepperi TaxID=113505 RepID=UPI00391F8C20
MLKILVLVNLAILCTAAPTDVKISPTVVGGNDASPGQFPYMVSIQTAGFRGSHGCGAGIINERWILSAAHCLLNDRTELYALIVGTVRMDEGGVIYGVERIIRHPSYVINVPPFYISNWFDIGLIKTTTRIIFNEFVQPIPLGRRRINGNTRAILAGFGAYSPNITIDSPATDLVMSRHLQYMPTTIISHNECNIRTAFFNALNPFYLIKPFIHPTSHICTVQPASGLCFGDSGSLLIANGEAVGVVVSGVRLCAQVDAAPDIYTRVSSFIGWIESYIHELD